MFGIPVRLIVYGLLAVAMTVFAWQVYTSIYERGARDAVQTIEKGNAAAGSAADKAQRNVLNCPPGKWNKDTHKCDE